MTVLDVRDKLLRADFSYGKRGPNTSITFHWNGGPVAADADPLEILKADARFHVQTRGWDGISYHRAYWRDGTCYITRDWDDTLAASGDGMGNADSSHWQLMVGTGQSPTPEMLAAVARDLRAELEVAPLDVFPHRYWSSTTCPGDELTEWVDRRAWTLKEGEMTREEQKALVREVLVEDGYPQTIVAMKEAYDPLVAEARAAGVIDAAQERKLAELDTRLAAIGRAAAPTR